MTIEQRIAALVCEGISLTVSHVSIGSVEGAEIVAIDSRRQRMAARSWVWFNPGKVEEAINDVVFQAEQYLADLTDVRAVAL